MSSLQEPAASKLQTSNKDTANEAISIIKRLRKHIDIDDCKCCREAIG